MAKKSEPIKTSGRISDILLEADGVSIVFGGLRAVSNFYCKIKKGELVGLIGPNGAGKTTIFNMLSGVYSPTEGSIIFSDKNGIKVPVHSTKPHQLAKLGIARTFQNIRLFENLTVLDNVLIAMHMQRKMMSLDALLRTPRFYTDEKRLKNKAIDLLALFKIETKQNEYAKNLAYGEQRKLEIVRALATDPSLLLLDEPAAGMNPQETVELMDLISFIRKEFNLTVLLIEHDMNLVMGICERLIVLDYGRIIATGLPGEIKENPEVIKAYLGEEAMENA